MEGRMERMGWDISLVEVVDVDVYMYVLVMTTVIYNSPHDLSCVVFFFCTDWNQHLGQSFHLEHTYIYIQPFLKSMNDLHPPKYLNYLPTSLQQRQPFSSRSLNLLQNVPPRNT